MPHRSRALLYYHYNWGTCNRERIISRSWEATLFDFLKKKCLELRCRPIEVNGVADHVHVLLRGNTNLSPAKIAHIVKGASSYMVNHEKLCHKHFGWQDGYGVVTVSPHGVDAVARYIRNQKQHHAEGTMRPEWEQRDEESEDEMPPPPGRE